MQNRIGFGKRFGAAFIDLIILIIVSVVVGSPVAVGTGTDGGSVSVLAQLIPLAYMSVEAFTGWTLGKRALGISIGSADGTRAPSQMLLTRFAIKNSATILALLGGVLGLAFLNLIGALAGLAIFVGCFFVFAESRQALHDRLAGTAVYPLAALGEGPAAVA